MSKKSNLIVLAGPTAVGKTELCVELARSLCTVVVSADSRQFYREMTIGTAKPLSSEMKGIEHYFIDSHSIYDGLSSGEYEVEVIKLLEFLFSKYENIILTGGSGLYIKAVCEGFDEFPDGDIQIRESLNHVFLNQGLEPLLNELKEKDQEYYLFVDKANSQRVIRALEIIRASGIKYSSFRTHKAKERPFNIIKIGLERERQELYDRINQRVGVMLDLGLVEEVKSLYSAKNINALQTVGYQEIFDYLEGRCSLEEATELIKRNTRRYAKRQMTWFKKDKDFKWFYPGDVAEIMKYIEIKKA